MNHSALDDSDLAAMPPELEGLVRGELAADEKLTWVGRPRVGRMVLGSLPIFLFGIFFGGFALFWVGTA